MNRNIFLEYHLNKYPKMTKQDIIKLVYQATLGPRHFSSNLDINKVTNYLLNELKEYKQTNENLYEYIGNNYIRVNIFKYQEYNFDLNHLINIFLDSTNQEYDKDLLQTNLLKYLSNDDLLNYDYLPVSHSEVYRNNYFPHYRVVNSKHLSLEYKIVQFDNYLKNLPDYSIISLEGFCASGKTTLTNYFKDKYTVIPIDDFFLEKKLKTKDRLNEIGGNINYELIKEMLVSLKLAISNHQETFTYLAFDCTTQNYFQKEISLKNRIILEGVYSSHPYFRDLIDYIVLLYVDQETRLNRVLQRELKDMFLNEWMEYENIYFNKEKIIEICNLII